MYADFAIEYNTPYQTLVDDLITLLTGETDINSAAFSSYVHTELSDINVDNTTSPWETIALDNQFPANEIPTTGFTQAITYHRYNFNDLAVMQEDAYGRVIRSKVTDADVINDTDPMYKYVLIFATNTAIGIRVFESWNDVDRVGLNEAANGKVLYTFRQHQDDVMVANVPPTANYIGVYPKWSISASAKHILFYMHGHRLPLTGANVGNWGPFGVVEHTRRSAWDTKDNNFPPFGNFAFSGEYKNMFIANTPSIAPYPIFHNWASGTPLLETALPINQSRPPFSWCRTLDASNDVDVFGVDGFMQHVFTGGDVIDWHVSRGTVGSNRTPINQLISFGVSNYTLGHAGGDISSLIHCYVFNDYKGAPNDVVTVNNVDYIIWVDYQSHARFLVRVG